MLVELNTISTKHAAATKGTNVAINHPFNYLASYTNGGILHRAIKMVLAALSDDGFHNESKVRSQSGAHVFLAEYEPIPIWNGTILTIS